MRSERYHDELHTFRGDTKQRRHHRNGGSSCAMDERRCRHDMMMIVYEIRLIAVRELSPPFGEERASTAVEQEISFPANKQCRQLWNSESL